MTATRTESSGGHAASAGHGAPTDQAGGMLRLEEALARMLDGLEPLPAEEVALDDLVGRVAAADVAARVTLPPWDNSAMDGFAVRAVDTRGASAATPVELRVTGESAAGHAPSGAVELGTALRILTGAMLPEGADAIVPVEATDAPPGMAAMPERVRITAEARPGDHIRRTGSDIAAGTRILAAGEAIRPATLSLLAATGHAGAIVHRRPKVVVLGTGDELVPAGQPLGPAQIPDSNSPALAAQARAAGAQVRRPASLPDRLERVQRALREAVDWADVVIVSGGVSVGAHDVVRQAFETVGRVDLWRVAVQPGKPLAFGRAPRAVDRGAGPAPVPVPDVLLFGLPGNPVSSFVTFELFVRPVLQRLAGHHDPERRRVRRARLAEAVRTSHGRRAFLRVRLEPDPDRAGGLLAHPVGGAGGQGSHILSALAAADALAIVPEEHDELPAGAEVETWELDR